MRRFTLITGVLAAFLLTACDKESPAVSARGEASLVVDIQGLPLAVKADGQHTEAERRISSLDLAVYDASGSLEWSQHYDNPTSARQTATGLEAGVKTICAAANISLGTLPQTLAGFKAFASVLSDNKDAFVMSGDVAAQASPEPEPVTLKLSRLAAKVSFEGMIATDWTEKAPASFDITDVYLANVSSDCSLGLDFEAPSVNLRSKVDFTDDVVMRKLTVSVKENWEPGDPFNGGVSFYCYPNVADARTCVMIKALYDGRVCYYPLVIDREIRNNTLYRIGNVTLTCEGVENPWDDFTKVKTSFEITISDWDYNEYPEIDF